MGPQCPEQACRRVTEDINVVLVCRIFISLADVSDIVATAEWFIGYRCHLCGGWCWRRWIACLTGFSLMPEIWQVWLNDSLVCVFFFYCSSHGFDFTLCLKPHLYYIASKCGTKIIKSCSPSNHCFSVMRIHQPIPIKWLSLMNIIITKLSRKLPAIIA